VKNYTRLSKREAIDLALMVAIDRGDDLAEAKFRKALTEEGNPPNRNMRRIVALIVALVVAFLIGVMFAPYLHAGTSACYIMARESTRTWRYGTTSSQTRNEIRRTIARGMPFGYAQVRGNCMPPVRIN